MNVHVYRASSSTVHALSDLKTLQKSMKRKHSSAGGESSQEPSAEKGNVDRTIDKVAYHRLSKLVRETDIYLETFLLFFTCRVSLRWTGDCSRLVAGTKPPQLRLEPLCSEHITR